MANATIDTLAPAGNEAAASGDGALYPKGFPGMLPTPPVSRSALAQAALLLLAPAGTGTRTLALGDNASAVSFAASYLGSEGLEVDGGPGALDELAAASADTIVLNRALKRFVPLENPGAAQALFVRCLRVLKPGGCILLTMDNPYSLKNFGEALRSSPTRVWHAARWHRRCVDALRRLCDVTDVYLLWPTAQSWKELRPEASGLPTVADGSLRGRVEQLVLLAARLLGLGSAIAPGHLLIARRRGDPMQGGSLAEDLQQAEGQQSLRVIIAARANSRCATFAAGELFFKVPLGPTGAESLRAEVGNLAGLPQGPVTPFTPQPARLRRHAGVRYATFAQLPPCDRAPRESDMIEFMRALHGEPSQEALSQTGFWSRVFAEDVREMLGQLGAGPLLQYLERRGGRRMPSGRIHGDLHFGNVMAHGVRKHLVDWDRYEACSPVLLDYAEAFLSCAGDFYREDRRVPLAALLSAIGRRNTVLATELTRACGELSPEEAVTVYVLHRASWMLRRHGLSDGPEREIAREHIAFCRRHLALGDPG